MQVDIFFQETEPLSSPGTVWIESKFNTPELPFK